jgi:hypothetical protein
MISNEPGKYLGNATKLPVEIAGSWHRNLLFPHSMIRRPLYVGIMRS